MAKLDLRGWTTRTACKSFGVRADDICTLRSD
jgi:hypothetical protein